MAHRLAPEVSDDLDRIWYNIARRSGGNTTAADRVIEAITDRFVVLGRHPSLGRRRDHDLRSGLRSHPVGDHLIIYTVEEK